VAYEVRIEGEGGQDQNNFRKNDRRLKSPSRKPTQRNNDGRGKQEKHKKGDEKPKEGGRMATRVRTGRGRGIKQKSRRKRNAVICREKRRKCDRGVGLQDPREERREPEGQLVWKVFTGKNIKRIAV